MIVMGKTDPGNSNLYIQQSQVLVPMNTSGLTMVRLPAANVVGVRLS